LPIEVILLEIIIDDGDEHFSIRDLSIETKLLEIIRDDNDEHLSK
jgi:hypothetical protein